jgi:DNA-binding transcriptional ArsR family regulator
MPLHDTLLGDRSASGGLSEDTIFSILSNQRRRYVLRYLDRVASETTLSDLAERIAAWENDVDVAELEYEQRKRVYTSLHQTHLPKLDEAGIVDYDRDRGTVTVAAGAADLEAYLASADGDGREWSRFYLVLSALSLVSLLAVWVDVVPFGGLPFAAGVVVAFAVSAVVHARRSASDGADRGRR